MSAKKRMGQAAIEYLVTYGWILIIIMFVIISLAYAGFFDPSRWIAGSNEAIGLGTFKIDNLYVKSNGVIYMNLENAADSTINLRWVAVDGTNLTTVTPPLPTSLAPGSNISLAGISTLSGASGTAFFNKKIQIGFDVEGGASGHVDAGWLNGEFQPS
ncbi:MAG: hypothetical protein ABIH99_01835 [Candidatus Micrarchaeota archaeon]